MEGGQKFPETYGQYYFLTIFCFPDTIITNRSRKSKENLSADKFCGFPRFEGGWGGQDFPGNGPNFLSAPR